MRALSVLALVFLVTPPIARAQNTATPSSGAPTASTKSRAPGPEIGRDEYIQKAVERARRNAEKRFDKMDANHDGILTAEERRAARAARRVGSAREQ